MERLKNYVLNNKKILHILIGVFAVFMNCCGFPFYNFIKNFGLGMDIISMIVSFECFFLTGGMLRYALNDKEYAKVFILTIVYALLGMACRYLLEFGEVSNTYNFTAGNIAFHMFIGVIVTYIGWFWYKRKI